MSIVTGNSLHVTHEDSVALDVLRAAQRAGELVHLKHIPGRDGQTTSWPKSVRPDVVRALADKGIADPWTHQAEAARLALDGRDVILATRAASGKSAGYLAPALSAAGDGGTALYIAPTKALAADQLRAVRALGLPGIRPACYDGDTTRAERGWAQSHSNYLLTNPDMLHGGILPFHHRWHGFFQRLRVIVVDECHTYRGVFGSHVAQVLRRLRRIAVAHGGAPVFVLASATIADPSRCARLLTGADADAVTDDGSPRAPLTFVLWDPPLLYTRPGERERRSATAEAADLLSDLVGAGVPSLAFTRSRRAAELVARGGAPKAPAGAPSGLPQGDRGAGAPRSGGSKGGQSPPWGKTPSWEIRSYRSGYLPDERRALEEGLRNGTITGMAATTALELGVDIPGLDAVLIAGWPGSWASLWQQAGRAGRAGRPAVAVFIAGDDPLDAYLLHHPGTLLEHPVEPAVLDPDNPHVLGPHLVAAAAEAPLSEADLGLFGPEAPAAASRMAADGELRRRGADWYPVRHRHPARQISLRADGEEPVRLVEEETGRLVGTMDAPSAHRFAHDGAVYLHQGETYLVSRLNLDGGVALVEGRDPGYVTQARDATEISLVKEVRRVSWGDAAVAFGDVEVTRRVTGYSRIRNGRKIGESGLDLPDRVLVTKATWLIIPNGSSLLPLDPVLPGAVHAAEHAAIGLLPLFATCDRRDVGGLSAARHPATGEVSVFVYDTHEGGAGFAERGFNAAAQWLRATRDAIASCPCESGCPSCIQSPTCGAGNAPLSKTGAVDLLSAVLPR